MSGRARLDEARALDGDDRSARRARPSRRWRCTSAPPPTPALPATDVAEALLHVAIYAGVPAANAAIKYAKQAFENWP
jgi:hypothetical protein